MPRPSPDLSVFERTLSALFGLSLSCLASRSTTTPVVRAITGLIGAGLMIRAATGHRFMKAALMPEPLIPEPTRPETVAEPPSSSSASVRSASIDEALEGTFPASDPPASRLPDEPPRNAAAKWTSARAAPQGPSEAEQELDKDR